MLEALLCGSGSGVEVKCADECETRDALTLSHTRCQGFLLV